MKGLRKARQEKGWSLRKLAEIAGLGVGQCVYRYEREDCMSNPNLVTVVNLADALGLTLDELVNGYE
jgi:transcriptional regulator with XRE-family HTH domain